MLDGDLQRERPPASAAPIEATVEVLGELGAFRLTMDRVAGRADAATHTVYNYFSTTQRLPAALQER